jgi:hypothetical protein
MSQVSVPAFNLCLPSQWQQRNIPNDREPACLAMKRNINVKLVEPPSCISASSCNSASSITFIGRNSRGNWVAREQHGLYGGLFVNRAQALKYALFENGHHPETIVELRREIELDISGRNLTTWRRLRDAPAIFQEGTMVQLHSASDQAQVLDTMIGLTRLSLLQRAIIGGSDAMELYLGLRRRGFMRVMPISTNWLSRRQHAIGLLADRNSAAVEKALGDISPFLSANATVAVLIYSDGSSLGVRTKLQHMGFQIEAGVRCHQGLVLSACRHGFGRIERAA